MATKFNQDLLEKFSGNLGKRGEHMGHSHVRNLVRVIAIVFSVNHMQLRLYGALSKGEMPWKILMLIYHCQRIKEDSDKSLCLLSWL